MKRFFNFALVLLTAAGLASCQRFEDEAILPDAYSVIVNTAETRTANEGYNTVWSSGDEMTMFWKSSKGNPHFGKFSYTSGSTFTTEESVGSSAYRWYGVYPYSDSNTSYTEVSASIPASQTQNGNDSMAHLAGSGFPLWGRTDDYVPSGNTPVFTAHQVATVLKYDVTNPGETPVTVTKIQFSAPTAIAGACKADLTSENVVWQPSSSNTSQAVTLNVTNGSTIKNGESASFFVGAIPFSETGEYTVNVYATDGESNYVYTNKVNGKFVAESGKINTIPLSFVPGDPVAEKTYKKVTTAPTDWSGTYLIVKESANVAFAYNQENFKTPVTINNGTITTNDLEAYEVTVSESSLGAGKYDVKVGGQYLYKYGSSTDPQLFDTNISGSNQYFAEFSGNSDVNINFHRSGGSNNYFQYSDSKFNFAGSSSSTVQLYKLSEGDTPDVPPTPSTDKTYKKVTSFTSGKHYVIAEGTNALKNNNGNIASASINGKVNGNTLTLTSSEAASLEWTATSSSVKPSQGEFTLNNGSSYLRRANSTNAAQLAAYDSGSVGYFVWFLSGTGNNLYNVNSTGRYTFYLDYNNGWTADQQNATNAIVVYEEDGSTPATKQNQTLSFASSSVEWTLGDTYKVDGTYDAQAVTGAKTTVTFKSSDTSVATISDGKIKIVGAGTTNIIATAAENDTYKSGSASYTLTINPAQGQPTTKVYTKVTSAPTDWSGTYIIVDESEGKAFDENASSSYASNVAISDGKIAWSETVAKYEVTISKSSVSGMYDLKTVSGNYMYSYDYGKDTWKSSNKQSNNTYYNSLSISGGNVTMYSTRTGTGSPSVNYFGYESSASNNPNSKNFGYKDGATTRTVQFYKLSEGGDEPATKQDQTISFANSSVEWTLGDTYKVNGTYEAQSVNDAHTTVTLSSSNTAVATISDGKIKIVAAGETTITATAAEDATYKSATATYKLTIKPAATPSSEKTYKKVTSISEGTYIICGSETAGTYVCLFPPVDATYSNQDKKFDTTNKCNHSLFSSSNTITEIKTSDTSIIGSEVEITASGSSWLIKLKSNGLYMYYNNGKIDFTSTSSSAAQTIGSFNSGKTSMKQGNQLFYHSGTNEGFGYKNRSDVSNLMFFKLDEGSTPDTPTPSGTTFNLENSSLSSYLNDVASSYTNSNYSTTVVNNYASRSSKDDVPAPVKLSWTGSATSISIYEGTSTSGTAVKSQSFTSSSSVDVYNLIPGKTYSYKTSNNQTGTFKTEGRRRMIKVSDNTSQNHARNCRDFGGIKTAAGQSLKYGLIYRGTNMDSITSDEKNVLLNELGIKMDVDLRGLQSGKSPLGSSIAVSGNGYQSGQLDESMNDSKIAQTLTDIMNYVIDGKPVYIHCQIGSDRTGYMCMLLQALLGVSKKECDIDYEITSFAGGIVGGTRPKEYTDNKDFRNKFVKSPYSADQVPQSVENYVTSTLNISLSTVKSFRKAMGVNETLN